MAHNEVKEPESALIFNELVYKAWLKQIWRNFRTDQLCFHLVNLKILTGNTLVVCFWRKNCMPKVLNFYAVCIVVFACSYKEIVWIS